MSTVTYAGTAVELNDEGFFLDANAWTPAMAEDMAREIGRAHV